MAMYCRRAKGSFCLSSDVDITVALAQSHPGWPAVCRAVPSIPPPSVTLGSPTVPTGNGLSDGGAGGAALKSLVTRPAYTFINTIAGL